MQWTNWAHLHVLVVKVRPPAPLGQLIPIVWLEQPLCRQALRVREPLPLGMSVGRPWLAHANTYHRPGGRQQGGPLVQAPRKWLPRRRKSTMDHNRMWKHVGFFVRHLFNIRAYLYCLKKNRIWNAVSTSYMVDTTILQSFKKASGLCLEELLHGFSFLVLCWPHIQHVVAPGQRNKQIKKTNPKSEINK